MAERAASVLEDAEFLKVWDERDRLMAKLIRMEAEYEETQRGLEAGEARMRELTARLQKEKGGSSKVSEEDYGAPSEVCVEPPLKLSAQLRAPSITQ